MNDFYVYLHRNKITGEIFYVGKGRKNRAYSKSGRSEHWKNYVNKYGYYVEFVVNGIQEWYALELEQNLISLYGRKDQNKGPLVNFTDGGDGHSNPSQCTREILRAQKIGSNNPMYGKTLTCEHKNKISEKMSGRSVSDAFRIKMSNIRKGCKLTREHREKLKKANLGKKLKEDTKDKIREKLLGVNSKKTICVEKNIVFDSLLSAVEYLKSEYPKASIQNISAVCIGKRKKAYGFSWRFVEQGVENE